MPHNTATPAKIAEYFNTDQPLLLAQTRQPRKAWVSIPVHERKPVTWDLIDQLRRSGVTVISVARADVPNRMADFTINEIQRHANRPLLGGSLI